MGTLLRRCRAHAGNFYLIEKEKGRDFTGEDGELLGLFRPRRRGLSSMRGPTARSRAALDPRRLR